MSLYLEQLPHQQQAVQAIINALDKAQITPHENIFANPHIKIDKGIDVKMETGTGKTYVYTQTMFELFTRYGINKFVLIVPSLAIKEGCKNFITASYTRQHFNQLYPHIHIDLNCINAGDFNTKGRKTIPAGLMDFLEASCHDNRTIKCLLINDTMLSSKSMTRDDYDQSLINAHACPIEALKTTEPVIIIDEPHRFAKNNTNWNHIQKLSPPLILRFGATFPLITTGKGAQKQQVPDYENLVYELNAIQAFNQHLVKWVDILYPSIDEAQTQNKYRIQAVSKDHLTLLKTQTKQLFQIAIGESLPPDFDGAITYAGKGLLSNDLPVSVGMTLLPALYASVYQENLLKDALNAHFTKERENWVRENCGENPTKVKTLALFFIDNIDSYRQQDGWLKTTFERLLTAKLKSLLETETLPDYRDFLQESLKDISATHGGYFAEDKNNSDISIQNEVEDILKNKEKLLSFKNNNGKWELRRFLFSKWTLREGWDNPNIFTITKLRSSGSEISKIQEVGRGLRLPVDEKGNRLSQQEWRLNFIIDYSEADFGNKLKNEINNDTGIKNNNKLTADLLQALVQNNYAESPEKAKALLLLNNIIDATDTILKADELLKLLPQDFCLHKRAVSVNQPQQRIYLRKENWQKLTDLWQQVIRRYMITYQKLDDTQITEIIQKTLNENVFLHQTRYVNQEKMQLQNGQINFTMSVYTSDHSTEAYPYGLFIKKLAQRTNIPVNMWHTGFCHCHPALTPEQFNHTNLERLIVAFQKVFICYYEQRFDYEALNFTAQTSLMQGGQFVESVAQSLLGTQESDDLNVEENYLYDKKVFDSAIEKYILQTKPLSQVYVFGKLPKKCIKVPKYTGGTTSPDFIYAIQDKKGVKLHLFVEAKPDDKRTSDTVAVQSQKKLFAHLNTQNIQWSEINDETNINDVIRHFVP